MASPALRGPSGQKMEKLEIETIDTPSSTKPSFFLRTLVVFLVIALCVCVTLHVAAGASLRGYVPLEPPLPGVMPGTNDRPRIILAQDVDWPPYAYYEVGTSGATGGIAGFGKDIAMGMGALCNLDITVVQTSWGKCWDGTVENSGDDGSVGTGLLDGHYHGCMTYTHAQGVRNRFLEFTEAVLDANKPAGLLVLLNADGTPKVDGKSSLAGLKIVDVAGWAPTADGLLYVENKCTGTQYAKNSEYTLLSANGDLGGGVKVSPNDHAMMMLRSGAADAVFLYADQAYNYECEADGKKALHNDAVPTWNCTLWDGFGSQYAYVQTGQFGHAINGTTIAMSKKGSGLSKILNPCLRKYMSTEAYYNVCKKHKFEKSCFKNQFFEAGEGKVKAYMQPTNEHTTGCADGYCSCPAR